MPYSVVIDPDVTGLRAVSAVLNEVQIYFGTLEDALGAGVEWSLSDAPTDAPFNTYLTYTVTLPANRGIDENGEITVQAAEIA